MTEYYGIGCTYDEDVSEEFFQGNMICISSRTSGRLYFKGMFDNVKSKDIVFLKSVKRGKDRFLRIKAIGIVDNNDQEFESDYGHSKKVEWLHYIPDGIVDIPLIKDGGVQRNTRIYREYNPEIIAQIDGLVERYKKD